MWDRYEYTILQHFLVAIFNDDYTALTDAEKAQLDSWLDQQQAKVKDAQAWHWAVDVADCTNFARCEISGFLGEVADIALVFKTKD